MHSFKPIWFVLFVAVFSFHCKKSNLGNKPPQDQLPPETQTGANTFGCKINGNVWLPKGSFSIPRWKVDIFSPTQLTLFAARNEVDSIISLSFIIAGDDNTYPRTYIMDTASKRKIRYGNMAACYYESETGNQSRLEITRQDLANRIISGRFSASFPAQGACPPVEITEGRFDIKY